METTTTFAPLTPFVTSFGYYKASSVAFNAGITPPTATNTYPYTFVDNIESNHSGAR